METSLNSIKKKNLKKILEIKHYADSHLASLQKVCIHVQATEQCDMSKVLKLFRLDEF